MNWKLRLSPFPASQILFALLVWSLLILRFGYRFGTGDHSEYLPYTLYLDNPSLYPFDYYINSVAGRIPNERYIIASLFVPFVNQIEVVCFIFNLLITVLLITGLERLGNLLTGNILVVRLAILVNFLLLFDRGLGNVELYNDAIQGTSLSVAIIAHALYYFFKERHYFSTLLLSLATIIHPVEGLTASMLAFAVMFISLLQNKGTEWRRFVACLSIYSFTAVAFVLVFLSAKFDGISAFSQQFDNVTFYRIYHEMRGAHHYAFKYFPLTDKIFYFIFSAVCIYWGWNFNKKIFWFALTAFIGVVVYVICASHFYLVDIANLQFFKVTQWIKFFAALFLVQMILKTMKTETINKIFNEKLLPVFTALMLTGVVISFFYQPDWLNRPGVYHQYGYGWKQKNDAVGISLMIDTGVNKKAVFVQPFGFSELKFHGRISSWVDWKAFPTNRGGVGEWYRRVRLIYGVTIDDSLKGFQLKTKADDYFYNLNEQSVSQLKKEGVTHLVSPNLNWANGHLLFHNNTYAVYQL